MPRTKPAKQSQKELAALQAFIGEKADLPVHKNAQGAFVLMVRVIIRDVRRAYGRVDFLVEPVAGSGTAWVDRERLTLDREKRRLR